MYVVRRPRANCCLPSRCLSSGGPCTDGIDHLLLMFRGDTAERRSIFFAAAKKTAQPFRLTVGELEERPRRIDGELPVRLHAAARRDQQFPIVAAPHAGIGPLGPRIHPRMAARVSDTSATSIIMAVSFVCNERLVNARLIALYLVSSPGLLSFIDNSGKFQYA